MAASQPPLTLIVAATLKNGIGKNGGLPWPMLKKEMAYFARVTKRLPAHQIGSQDVHDKTPQNVVIMGRKTWESIPPKFRPLPKRTNLIISSRGADSFGPLHEDVHVDNSIESGLAALQSKVQEGQAKPVGKVFIIGGSSIYDLALKLPTARHILLTRIENEFDCDTFFPIDLESKDARDAGWQRQSHVELLKFTGEELEDENMVETANSSQVRYQFTLYEKS